MLEILVVGVAALLTSILSAVAGLGGGVVLLLVVAQFVAPTVAIPIQGAIQLVSNGSRAALLRQQISWPVVGWASILMFPASLLGVAVATSLPDDVVRLLLAGFVLVLAWRPALLKASNTRSRTPSDAKNMLIGVGAASGVAQGIRGDCWHDAGARPRLETHRLQRAGMVDQRSSRDDYCRGGWRHDR
jgi:uncharacterized membrane protein YfcA